MYDSETVANGVSGSLLSSSVPNKLATEMAGKLCCEMRHLQVTWPPIEIKKKFILIYPLLNFVICNNDCQFVSTWLCTSFTRSEDGFAGKQSGHTHWPHRIVPTTYSPAHCVGNKMIDSTSKCWKF